MLMKILLKRKEVEIDLPPTFDLNIITETEVNFSDSERFYSPLVRSIIKKEGIDFKELDQIKGSW